MSISFSILRTISLSRSELFQLRRLGIRRMSTLNTSTSPDPKPKGLLSIFENNPKRLKRVLFLGKLFESEGFELRIAGGAVRDILGGIEPKDIDFATTARPEQSLDILKKHEDLLRIIVTAAGQRHGTVKVKFKETEIDFKRIKTNHLPIENAKASDPSIKPEYDEEQPFDITTLRCDNITDGRHAEVEFINDWKIDSERRDLTINAMFLTINEGKLVDYFGGESDLKGGVVRFVGDADLRIREDYLRILRFFRFWSRYGKHNMPDPQTTSTIQKNLDGLDKISGERLWQEIKKTLCHIPCYEVVKLMLDLKLFEQVGLKDEDIDYEKYVKSVLDELKLVEKNVQTYSELIQDSSNQSRKKMWVDIKPIVLFTPLVQNSTMCFSAHQRMKFSNNELDSMQFIIDNKGRPVQELKYQFVMSSSPGKMKDRLRALSIYEARFDLTEDIDSWPVFPLDGILVKQEIMRRKLKPGDKIRHILESLKILWASSDYTMSGADLEKVMKSNLDELQKLGLI